MRLFIHPPRPILRNREASTLPKGIITQEMMHDKTQVAQEAAKPVEWHTERRQTLSLCRQSADIEALEHRYKPQGMAAR